MPQGRFARRWWPGGGPARREAVGGDAGRSRTACGPWAGLSTSRQALRTHGAAPEDAAHLRHRANTASAASLGPPGGESASAPRLRSRRVRNEAVRDQAPAATLAHGVEGRCVFDLRLAAGPDAVIGDVGVQDEDGPIALDRQGPDAVQDEGRLAGGRRHRLGGLADLLAGELGLDLAGQEAPEGGAVALDEGGEEGAGQGEELLLVGGGVGGAGRAPLGFRWGASAAGAWAAVSAAGGSPPRRRRRRPPERRPGEACGGGSRRDWRVGRGVAQRPREGWGEGKGTGP